MEERLILSLLIKIRDNVTLSYIGKKYRCHFNMSFYWKAKRSPLQIENIYILLHLGRKYCLCKYVFTVLSKSSYDTWRLYRVLLILYSHLLLGAASAMFLPPLLKLCCAISFFAWLAQDAHTKVLLLRRPRRYPVFCYLFGKIDFCP